MLTDLATVLTWRGDLEGAIAQCTRAEELDPSLFLPPFTAGWAHVQAGKVSGAIPALQRAVALGAPPFGDAWLGYAYGASGNHGGAAMILGRWSDSSRHGSVPPFARAIAHLGTGDRERALDELETAYAARSPMMIGIKMDRTFDSIRSEPRFVALLRKVGFGT